MCVSSRFWVASVLRGNSHDIVNVLESHAVTSTLSHHVVLSQWEGNFTWSGILLQVLQRVLQTLFRHFIPCVILVSPRKCFITNSICSENYFPSNSRSLWDKKLDLKEMVSVLAEGILFWHVAYLANKCVSLSA